MRMQTTADVVKAVVLWALWQFFVLFALGVAFVNVFTEYGWFPSSPLAPYAAVAFLAAAIWLGTWLPVRRWKRGL